VKINQILQSKTPVVNSQDRTPHTFKQWYDSTTGLIPGQEYRLYTEYLIEWYKQYSTIVQDSRTQIKLKYLSLLKQLQLFFSTQELENWYNKINIEDEKELLLAIPYFARKLKEISYYYFRLRDKVKNSRIRHNLVGTEFGLTQQIRELLLENYTQDNISIPASIWQKIPALSSISTDIHIVVEDLYDTFSYYDHSNTLPASAYYDFSNTDVQDFILSRGLALSSTDWLYKLGTTAFSLSTDDTNLQELHQQLVNQTIGNNLFTTETYTVSTKVDIYNIIFETGTNSFYWPYGNYPNNISTLPRYEPVPLSSEEFKQIGRPGDSLFIRTKQGIEGAWLYNKTTEVQETELQAKLNADRITLFKFPFPGYGISAEDIPWTGFNLTTDIRFNYLDDDIKRAIERVYWNTDTSLSSVQTIKLNDTTLASQGAYPSTVYANADKIRVRKISPQYNSSNYVGSIDEAWLYRMNETSISIPAKSEAKILWPFKKLQISETFELNFPINNFNEVCESIPLTSIKLNFSLAGQTFNEGDKIFKIKKTEDSTFDATECAWLSAPPYYNGTLQLTGTTQSGLNCVFLPGQFTRFIWNGINNTDINRVLKPKKHYLNCEYLKITNPKISDFTKCTCKQVNFTPFGHPGKYFTDYNQQTDFIVEDNFTPQTFDLNTWRDNTGTRFPESTAFCWFKTDSNVGWSSGKWNSGATSTNNNFYLKKGKGYVYYRANARTGDSFPEYIVNHSYNQYFGTWIKGVQDSNKNWIATSQPSDMILYPGDFLIYSRSPSIYYSLTGETLTPIATGTRLYSVWSSYDLVSIPKDITYTSPDYFNTSITVSHPIDNQIITTSTPFSSQYPSPGTYNKIINYVAWKLTTPSNEDVYFYNTPSFIFTPLLTGVYTTSLTAITGVFDGDVLIDGYYYFNNIPPITATVLNTRVISTTSTNIEAPGFTLRYPLKGWDYNINSYNPNANHNNIGAKPYWATFDTSKSNLNKASIDDNYNLITVPDVSDIEFSGGEQIEYNRKYNTDLIWNQPITLFKTVNEKIWSALQINVSGLSNKDLFENSNNTYITQLSTPTTIVLQNFIENEPLEVIYNANSNFTWSITAKPIIESTIVNTTPPYELYNSILPWQNILNQTNPTIALAPTVESLISYNELGGFFTPQYSGLTKYLNKDYTYTLDVTSSALTGTFLDPDKAINIRGLSKQDQPTPYTFVDNNTWLKEPPISSNIAGTINKNVFKQYQKFIPYQSTYESNPKKVLGLITPTSQQTPWNGAKNTEWGDSENFPRSYTEVINVSSWVSSQVLKNNNLFIDNWSIDIYGNQYGLYKNFSDSSYSGQQNIPGEIWIRNNKQRVLPGYIGLSSIFDTYFNTPFYTQLTGNGIYKIDVFYNTLYIETSGVILLEKVNYDYNLNQIFSTSDDARFISLMVPVTSTILRELNNENTNNFAIAGETWFDPIANIALFSTVNLSGYNLVPNLFEYNLVTGSLRKVFPVLQRDYFKLSRLLDLQLNEVFKPKLSYNKNIKQYIFAIPAKSVDGKNYVIELKLNNLNYDLYSLTTYQPTTEILPPTVTHSLLYNLTANESFSIQVTSSPAGATFTGISLPSWVGLNTGGNFSGTVPFDAVGSYFATFTVNNENGTTYQNLTLNVL
jgi:hypothetical protein